MKSDLIARFYFDTSNSCSNDISSLMASTNSCSSNGLRVCLNYEESSFFGVSGLLASLGTVVIIGVDFLDELFHTGLA